MLATRLFPHYCRKFDKCANLCEPILNQFLGIFIAPFFGLSPREFEWSLAIYQWEPGELSISYHEFHAKPRYKDSASYEGQFDTSQL